MLNGKSELERILSLNIKGAIDVLCQSKSVVLPENFKVEIEEPKDKQFGDLSTNSAMKLSKLFSMNPRDLANLLIDALPESDLVEKVDIAGPGFVNFYISKEWLYSQLREILDKKSEYGKIVLDEPKSINVEYVSANPTGPLHIGNARGGAIGDVIANIYEKAGWNVTKEFYLNDAGNQIVKFGESLYARFKQIDEPEFEMPENAYMGDDIRQAAVKFREEYPESADWRKDEVVDKLTAFALNNNIENLHKVLGSYGINYDVWFKESSLHSSGAVEKAIDVLKSNGAVYEKDGAVWFKATDYDCEKDEVLVRANGIPTYYAADIAYHLNKLAERKFDMAVNVWGADHHGHVHRLKMALKAAGVEPERLEIILMQLVHLVKGNESVRISKRRGDMVTLDELLSEVKRDAVRFIFNSTTPSSHLEFDLDLAVKESNDNPVFYVQYAHARICSILRNVAYADCKADFAKLTDKTELALIMKMTDFSKEILNAANEYDPSKITKYAYDLASLFHSFYNVCRVKNEDEALMNARLSLVEACKYVLKNTLDVLGVDAPEEM